MTDAPDLPPEHDAVRRMLADARHRDATPPEVVARLDEALAGLVAERATPSAEPTPADDRSPAASVVDLTARRRRRAGAGLLVAAAAVVVAGVAVGQVLPTGGGSDDSGGNAASSAEGGGEPGATSSQQDSFGAEAGRSDSDEELGSAETKREITPQSGLPSLSSADAGLRDRLLALRSGAARGPAALDQLQAASACRTTATGPGRRLPVEVDGQVGLVVYRAPAGADQDAVVYVCGTPEPVRTVTLPAP